MWYAAVNRLANLEHQPMGGPRSNKDITGVYLERIRRIIGLSNEVTFLVAGGRKRHDLRVSSYIPDIPPLYPRY